MIERDDLKDLYIRVEALRRGEFGEILSRNDPLFEEIAVELRRIEKDLFPASSKEGEEPVKRFYPSLENRKILLIDDDEKIHRFFQLILPDSCRLITAREGGEALEILKTDIPDLILLDIMMPGIDGLRFLDSFASLSHLSMVPVIVLSSLTASETQVNMIRKGAIAYMVKPLIESVTLEKINALLSLQQRTRAMTRQEMKEKIDSLFPVGAADSLAKKEKADIFARFDISFREQRIAEEILTGKSNKQIAADLSISANTVGSHVQNLYRKCGVNSRVELYKLFHPSS